MCHELARQVGGNHIHMEFVEMEVYAYRLHGCFHPAISTEIPFARCHEYAPSDVFKAEYDNSNQTSNSYNAKEHLAEHFEVTSKCQQIGIIQNIVILMLLLLYQFFWLLLRLPFLVLLLRHSLPAPLPTARSCLS